MSDPNGVSISYAELSDRCAQFAAGLGPDRQLILIEADNDVASVVAYLGALGGGHVVILTGPSGPAGNARIVAEFAPTAVFAQGRLSVLDEAPPCELHPELALLLPTSGSTGSPKLVRLTKANLAANANAIVEYLAITGEDRAITSLPFHYSYGLSVLNSHLAAGASVVLTDLSVTNPAFWTLFNREGVTSFAGVPYSYELLERIGFRDAPPPTLKTMMQAGGKLAPDVVRTYARFAERHGIRFFVMYGQTEASPRMAYLPPERALDHGDCIGVPVPGGAFRLVDEDGRTVFGREAQGELVYSGPNVMMGYALARGDLAKGAELGELRTGDLAVLSDAGLYRIVGRANRFVKIAGLRIGLDDLEAMLRDQGREVVVAGNDRRIAIAVLDGADPVQVREHVASRCGLPIACVTALGLDEAPRLASGKPDYQALLGLAEREAARIDAEDLGGGVIASAYARALGIAPPSSEATFITLGGDSLAYVNASMAVERALGHLPAGWERMSIGSLEAMAPSTAPAAPAVMSVSSELVVRVLALIFITTRHATLGEADFLLGGSNVLFALAGYSLAKFQRDELLKGSIGGALWGAAYRIVLPYVVIMTLFLFLSDVDRSISWPMLTSVFVVEERGPLFIFWFIESIVHAILITCAILLVGPFRRFAAKRPFASALAMVGAAAGVMIVLPMVWNDGRGWHLTVDAWLYAYFLGWAACVARGVWQKVAILALAAALTAYQHDFANTRALWLTLGLGVVMFVPVIRLPSLVARAILTLAAASYFIYLTHIIPIHILAVERQMTPYMAVNLPILLALSALIGLTYAWVWGRGAAWLAPRLRLPALR
ncbi:MAG: AMP-binding protein [Phenylobacterium sp.]|nr:AMP-binding protein [Phenylobacterium sp.]